VIQRLALIALVFPIVLRGEGAPTAAFQAWARVHVHALGPTDQHLASKSDLATFRAVTRGARVVAFGEPFHGGHEPLAFRNQLIRVAVTQLGFSAVALETDLTTSKRLYDHVLERSTEGDAVLRESFSYGFGSLPENIELIEWLRSYNAAQPSFRKVHFYGVDLAGQFLPYAYRSVEAVLNVLDESDPELRAQYQDVLAGLRSDKYPALTIGERNAITAKIHDLIAVVKRGRTSLSARTSVDDFDWVLQQAFNAAQDDAFLRALPADFNRDLLRTSPENIHPSDRWQVVQDMREVAIADNVRWVEQRERSRGRVLFFAHNSHVQTDVFALGSPGRPIAWPVPRWRPAGSFLRSAYGRDLVVIGTFFGRGLRFEPGEAPAAPDPAGTDGLLASLSVPRFIMNLHELPPGPLREWFETAAPTRCCRSAADMAMVSALTSFDDILYLDVITPSAVTGPRRW
jgi:erythromycin esterase